MRLVKYDQMYVVVFVSNDINKLLVASSIFVLKCKPGISYCRCLLHMFHLQIRLLIIKIIYCGLFLFMQEKYYLGANTISFKKKKIIFDSSNVLNILSNLTMYLYG